MQSLRTVRSLAPLALGLATWAALPSLEWCPVSWAALRVMCAAGVSCESVSGDSPDAQSLSLPAPEPCGQTGDAAQPSCDVAPGACAHGCTAVASPLCDPTPDDSAPLGDRAWCIHPPVDGIAGREIELRIPRTELPHFLATEPDAPAPPSAARIEWPDLAHAALTRSEAHAPPPARAPPCAEPTRA